MLRWYIMKLNPTKCIFGVSSVNQGNRGKSKKDKGPNGHDITKNLKEVQQLNGHIVA